MSLDISFESANQRFVSLSQLVDFPILLLFSDLNHALLTEFLQVGVYVSTAQPKTVGEVVALSGLVAESPQIRSLASGIRPISLKLLTLSG